MPAMKNNEAMKNSPNNWKSLLNRWISGEANRTDERSLEALAKDDPFLADALEGYRSMPESDHARSVTRVNALLRKQYEKRDRKARFYLLRVAAIGAFLLAAWFIFQEVGFSKQEAVAERREMDVSKNATENAAQKSKGNESIEKEVAKAEEQYDELDENAPQGNLNFSYQDGSTTDNNAAPPAVKITPPPSASTERVFEKEKDEKRKAETDGYADLKQKKKIIESEAKKTFKEDEQTPTVLDGVAIEAKQAKLAEADDAGTQTGFPAKDAIPAAPKPAQDAAVAIEDKAAVSSKIETIELTIKGRVTEANGDPLIGAAVLVDQTNHATITDVEGHFTIQSPMKEPNLQVSYTGYETQYVKVPDDRFLNIQLSEGMALEEVVVSANRRKAVRSETQSSARVGQPATPKGGFKKYEKYIRQNLHKPQAAIDAGVNGTVTLGFQIDEKGKPIDIKVSRSLGHGYDEEAVRLLENGPKWNGDTGFVNRYGFEFK